MWYVLGWILTAILVVSILYSGHFHSRNYIRMGIQAEEAEGVERDLHLRLARRYMWRTILMQLPKVVIVIILLNLLLR